MEFEWDENKARLNLKRHRIAFEEAIESFLDPNALDEFDVAHSEVEPRYNLIGLSSRRLLFIVYTESEEGLVRLISARKADLKHRKIYEQQSEG
ncbi:MAG: BrnT family toxin [Blastocatellia bacterium]|nr:BrnT family toxin [Blastocatellia bacterium]